MNVLSSVVLVVATLAMALGLGVVTASLTPSLEAGGDPAQTRLVVCFSHGARGPSGNLRGAGDDLSQPAPMPMGQGGRPPGSPPHVSATGPWKSPLYPQNGVTVWDRIRVSSAMGPARLLVGHRDSDPCRSGRRKPIP